jgi:hypothetical protein
MLLTTAATVVSFKEANNGDVTFNGRVGVCCGHYLVVDVQDDVRFVVVWVLVLCVALLCALSGGKLHMKMKDLIEFREPFGEMDIVVMRMTRGIIL